MIKGKKNVAKCCYLGIKIFCVESLMLVFEAISTILPIIFSFFKNCWENCASPSLYVASCCGSAAPVADPYGSKSSSGTDAKKQEVLLGRISMMVPKSLLVSLALLEWNSDSLSSHWTLFMGFKIFSTRLVDTRFICYTVMVVTMHFKKLSKLYSRPRWGQTLTWKQKKYVQEAVSRCPVWRL